MKGRVTKTGYRRNSPDVNNDYNVIPSNRISMRGVDFPVLGVDNLGNSELMYPGGEYEFQGDYVTELPAYGSGGLTQWFAEKWVDIKTGKECGRSGKDKNGRPYPACRPSKRVNSTTPKTKGEMSASEKAKFKKSKTSGKRINYNHKRAEEGTEVPLNRSEVFNIPRTVRYENNKMVLQDKPVWDGMLDEVTITPYTQSELAFQERMADKATGAIEPVYPLFEIMTAGLKAPATAGAKAIEKSIKKAPSKLNPNYYNPNLLAKGNPSVYYRKAGKDAYEDFVNSGFLRTRAEVTDNPIMGLLDTKREMDQVRKSIKEYGQFTYRHPSDFRAPYFSRGKAADIIASDEYLFQTRPGLIGDDAFTSGQMNILHGSGKSPMSVGGFGIMDPMQRAADNFDVFKKSWWHGYKPVKKYGGSLPKAQEGKEVLDPRLQNNYNSSDATYVNVNQVDPNILNRSEAQRIIDEAVPQTISSYVEPSASSKALNRLANPFTTAGYIVRGEKIPDRVPAKENVYDMAADIVNPAAFIDYGKQAADNFGDGNVIGGTLNAMSAMPFIPGGADDLLRTGKIGQLADDIAPGFKYKPGSGNPYQNLNVTDDMFKGPANYGVDYTGEIAKGRLDFVKSLGKELDDINFDANWIGPEHLRFHGSPAGRSVIEVALPGKTHQTQLFYKSSGLAGKSGQGVKGTTQGLWQPYGGHATMLHPQGPIDNWFIKDGGYETFYNSKSYRDVANRLDDLAKEAGFDLSNQAYKYQTGRQVGPPSLTPGPIQDKVYPMVTGPAEDNLENRIINAKSSAPKGFSRRDALLNASKRISEGQGGRPLEVLLNMTAFMENSLGNDPKAYGRDYTRSQMSIDDNAYADLFEPRGEYDYTSSQKKGFEWLKGMGYEPAKMDSILRTDDPVAAMATARLVYGRAPGALPNPDNPKEVYGYYMDNYNKSGALKYGNDQEHYKRFLDAYNDLYQKEQGGEQIPSFDIYDTYQRAWLAARKKLGVNKKFMYKGLEESTNT